MVSEKSNPFNSTKLLDNLPVAVFELQFHIIDQISRFNYLNEKAREIILKLLPKEKIETGFNLNDILDMPELQRRSMEVLIPELKREPLIFNNRQYLLNALNGKQIIINTDLQFTLKNDFVVLRGIGKEASHVVDSIKSKDSDIEAIKQEIDDFKQFFEAFDALIMIVDENGRILFVSPNVSDEMLYKPRKEIINKTFHDIFPKGLADFFLSYSKEAIDERKSVDYEYHLPISNKVRWYQSRIIPIEPVEGELRKTIAIIKDITKWKIKPI